MNIWIKDSNDRKVPFSRGVLAHSIMRTGLADIDSYELAESIKNGLQKKGRTEVSGNDIFKITRERLKKIEPKLARRYKLWHDIEHQKKTIFILLGGASGTGTTTVATELGHLLGIRRVIGTDIIREIMRKMISRELIPVLHVSTYDAWKYLEAPVSPELNKKIIGFRTQSEHVCVGVDALLERGLHEEVPVVVEGTHLLPGLLKKSLIEEPNVFFYVLKVSDEDAHKNRFYTRVYTSRRMAKKYIEEFDTIREIQRDIINKAKINDIPVLENTDIYKTVDYITEDVMTRMMEIL